MGHAQVGLSQRRFYFYIFSRFLLSKKVDLVSKHPAARPRQFVDGSSRELMMVLDTLYITDKSHDTIIYSSNSDISLDCKLQLIVNAQRAEMFSDDSIILT